MSESSGGNVCLTCGRTLVIGSGKTVPATEGGAPAEDRDVVAFCAVCDVDDR